MPAISDRLRAPDGCPWDREQTHESLRKHLLEEAYEVYDALEAGATPALAGELGDLLLQVVLHAQLAAEAGRVRPDRRPGAIATKIVRRHPARVRRRRGADRLRRQPPVGADQGRRARRRRRRRRPRDGGEEPAPSTASQPLAAGARREPGDAGAGRQPRLRLAVASTACSTRSSRRPTSCARREDETAADRAEEFGDLLFVLVNVARKRGIEAEAALRAANDKFRRRFGGVERLAPSAASPCATSTSRRSTSCGMPPRPEERTHEERRRSATARRQRPRRRPRPARPAPGQLPARRPEVGRGLVPRSGSATRRSCARRRSPTASRRTSAARAPAG